jgi:rubredoxin
MIETNATTQIVVDRSFICTICGWIYWEGGGFPRAGIEPSTRWENLPADFACFECGANPEWFSELRL